MVQEPVAVRFLHAAYRHDDIIAIAYRRLPNPQWCHRFLSVAAACAPAFQRWLRFLNAQGHCLFVSMNTFPPLTPGLRPRRTEANVLAIRHVYADFDEDGPGRVAALKAREDLPPPSYVLHSSPGKCQVIWNVDGFTPAAAKPLLRHLAYTLGADPAVHDLNRVLRLPGFTNHKYEPSPWVRLEWGPSPRAYPPSDFPTPAATRTGIIPARSRAARPRPPRGEAGVPRPLSQSERDWAWVRDQLTQGAPWHTLWETLVTRRQSEKTNVRYYASTTLINACMSLGYLVPHELRQALADARVPGPSATRIGITGRS